MPRGARPFGEPQCNHVPSAAMRMSISPQSGGFQEGARPRPRKPLVAALPSPCRTLSGACAGSVSLWPFFVGESDICAL